MPNQVTEEILNVKEEVLRFADKKGHTHKEFYTKDEIIENYAIKNHSWTDEDNVTYGDSNSDHYGHVKTIDTFYNNEELSSEHNDCVATKQAIIEYVTQVSNEIEEANTDMYNNIESALLDYDIESKLPSYSIVSAETITNNINEQLCPGHYHIVPSSNPDQYKIKYNNQDKFYANGFLDIRRINDKVIQELYTTKKDSNNQYQLNNEKYCRIGILTALENNEEDCNNFEVEWDNWDIIHIPYQTSDIRITNKESLIEDITLSENTSGYIITWTQDNPYSQQVGQYEWKKIASFSQNLLINGPYTFSISISNADIKIDKDGIYIRSKQQLGSAIEHIETQNFFVPRKG